MEILRIVDILEEVENFWKNFGFEHGFLNFAFL